EGGVISLNHDHPAATGNLSIMNGSLTIQGTAEYDVKVYAKVNAQNIGVADVIVADGITIAGDAKLKAITINLGNNGKVPPRSAWRILLARANTNISGSFPNCDIPLNDGTGNQYAVRGDGNPPTAVFLDSP
ncbi:MAG TPA: hypothetical protein VFW33_23245, partial [Gemmataceae bacterium]|nr:hypothetical protein [Gemmataceae bacterium]